MNQDVGSTQALTVLWQLNNESAATGGGLSHVSAPCSQGVLQTDRTRKL